MANSKIEAAEEGEALVETIVSASGLPKELAKKELEGILNESGHEGATVTLEKLREAMISYLESLEKDMKQKESGNLEPSLMKSRLS